MRHHCIVLSILTTTFTVIKLDAMLTPKSSYAGHTRSYSTNNATSAATYRQMQAWYAALSPVERVRAQCTVNELTNLAAIEDHAEHFMYAVSVINGTDGRTVHERMAWKHRASQAAQNWVAAIERTPVRDVAKAYETLYLIKLCSVLPGFKLEKMSRACKYTFELVGQMPVASERPKIIPELTAFAALGNHAEHFLEATFAMQKSDQAIAWKRQASREARDWLSAIRRSPVRDAATAYERIALLQQCIDEFNAVQKK